MKIQIISVLSLSLLLAAAASKEPEVPELNKKVLAFARDNLGKKVGDGECATLAVQALRAAEARPWSTGREGEYLWGKLVRTVEPKKNLGGDVLPGDILQFRDATLMSKKGRTTTESSYPHHTALVETVKDDGKVVELLHQNAGAAGANDEERRKVQRTILHFGDLKKGAIKIYRPEPKK
jgi:hypothetical protein